MGKIFSTKFNEGSMIEPISGGVFTATDVEFERRGKGLAASYNGATGKLAFTQMNLGKTHSIVCNCVIQTELDNNILGMTTSDSQFRPITGGAFRYSAGGVANKTEWAGFDGTYNRDTQIIVVREGTSVIAYQDGVSLGEQTLGSDLDFLFDRIGGTYTASVYFYGFIYTVEVYDHVLTTKERNKLYSSFLSASPVSTIINENLILPKKSDRSSEAGLVASYNMIPSAGGILVDTSGSGNNGTIPSGIVSSENGLVFPMNGGIQLTSSMVYSIATYSFRIFFNDVTTEANILQSNDTRSRIYIYNGVLNIETDTNAETFASIITGLTANNWYNIVVSRNGDVVTGYLDGVGQTPITVVGADDLTINRISGGASRFINGTIADLSIHSYAFTQDQAEEYHNSFEKVEHANVFSDFGVSDTIG